MKKFYIFSLIFVLIALNISMLGTTVTATETDNAQMSLTVTENDFVNVDIAVKNARFLGFQAAFRYDPEILVPVTKTGEIAEKLRDCRQKNPEAELFNEVGMELDSEKGLFQFTVYLMPKTEGENINEKAEYVADKDGVGIYTLRFKRLKAGNPKFEIALKDRDKPYYETVKNGILISNSDGYFPIDIVVNYENKQTSETVDAYVSKPVVEMTKDNRKNDVLCLVIDKPLAINFGKKTQIDDKNLAVVPYIKNDRTLVPLRFITEALGGQIFWDEERGGCTVRKGKDEIVLTFGSSEFTVNGETVVYDAPIEVVNDRTMVPVRFVSEELGYDVYWNPTNRAVVISPEDNPWVESRKAENQALGEMVISILGIL